MALPAFAHNVSDLHRAAEGAERGPRIIDCFVGLDRPASVCDTDHSSSPPSQEILMGSFADLFGPFLVPILNLIGQADGSAESILGSVQGTDCPFPAGPREHLIGG